MKNSNREKINNLQSIIRNTLEPLINNDFLLLDIPNHRNIGDSLIWKGEQMFFQDLKHNCLGEYNRNTFDFNDVKNEKINLLLHGGGNFGDIYRTSQDFRFKVLEQFPNNRIILLPQTVYYNDHDLLKIDLERMSKHKNLFLCVRDNVSLKMLQPYFDNERLFLLPDMAFFINIDNNIKSNLLKKEVLYMDRVDIEATERINDSILNRIVKDSKVSYSDWPTYNKSFGFLTKIQSFLEYKEGSLSKIFKKIPILNLLVDNAYGLKRRNGVNFYTDQGIEFINKYDVVLTTRLHGLILSVLLDKEIYVIDNSYGKCRTFYDAWLSDFENIKFLENER